MTKLLTLSLVGLLLCVVAGRGQTVRKGHGLNGPVHTLRTSLQTIVTEDGVRKENREVPLHLITFDRAGKVIESVAYGEGGAPGRRVVYLYDGGGERRTGSIIYSPEGVMVRKVADTFNANGTKATRTVHDHEDDGALFRKVVYAFDHVGELKEVAEYGPDQSLRKKESAPFEQPASPYPLEDAAPPDSEPRARQGAGGGERKPTLTRRHGDLPISGAGWGPEDSDLDAHGNWMKRAEKSVTSYQSGKKVERVVFTVRAITYYETGGGSERR